MWHTPDAIGHLAEGDVVAPGGSVRKAVVTGPMGFGRMIAWTPRRSAPLVPNSRVISTATAPIHSEGGCGERAALVGHGPGDHHAGRPRDLGGAPDDPRLAVGPLRPGPREADRGRDVPALQGSVGPP